MAGEEWIVTMPKLGETVTEGELTRWIKSVGDQVAFDDPLFEVSTDKVDSEIPSPYDGVIAEIIIRAGETVPIGTPVVRIAAAGSYVGDSSGVSGADRLPSASRAAAAAGGPSLSDPASPVMGGSEGMGGEDPDVGTPAGEVHDITMPKLGETVTEGELTRWIKNVGDDVAFDDPLFEVSTDKVDSEIPSPYDGVLVQVLVAAGETVPVGTTLARISAGGVPADVTAAAPAPDRPPAPSGEVGARPAARGGLLLSPLVRRLVAEQSLDLTAIAGTGVGGRIRREDVETAIAGRRGAAGVDGGPGPAAPPAEALVATPTVPVSPSAPAARTSQPASTAAPASAPTGDPRDEVVTLSRMRLAVADGMKRSQALAASVWTSVEVDFAAVDSVRVKHKERFKKETGSSLSYLPFVARAVIDALRAYPSVNSSIDVEARSMTLHPYVNLGIAVDLDQQGLVVPVVKNADGLNMRGVAQRITELAASARSKKLGAQDMRGSTFTITNPGPFASYASFPIINQPNVAILCTDGVKRKPVAVGDAIAIHPVGIIGLVYDHRAFDGSTGSLFLMHVRDSLEQRDWEAEVG